MTIENSPINSDLSTQMMSQIVNAVKTLTDMTPSIEEITSKALSSNTTVFTPQCDKDAKEKEKISFHSLAHPEEKASEKATTKVAPTKITKT